MGKQRPCLAVLMAAVAVIAMYRRELRPWMYTWGADDGEITTTLPGDEFVAAGAARTTRALTIAAPVRCVWPWLVQIGENRGGFYSYSLVEQMVGAHIRNASTIHPEWQDLHVGDTVWLARRYGDAARQVVAAVEAESHLVLVSPADFERVQRGEKATGAWSFCLRPQKAWTRLLVRGSGGAVGHPAFDVVHFLMEQKMMRGLRERAERERRGDVEDDMTQKRCDRGGIATVS
ncbi:hypothetical protein [Mycobacterium sp. 29Ha]|uniref:hypothetical protein n=1 Tax=Mycobacterium sp. 29Ha TaxID=2939268 RepID=UPI0029392388|nr:hypothetical protein [Mycobacterium sp. 29Ha]MDV3133777.1 hypothetical protein [Mycobacterium sp. 29Ha]